MEEFTFRSDDIDVERIMERIRAIRARIQEKRGVDYTQEQLRELASLQLERFQESKKVRSDLPEHYHRQRSLTGHEFQPPPQFAFNDEMIYASAPGLRGRLISTGRRLLNPVLKLFLNPQPIVDVLRMQGELNAYHIRQSDVRRACLIQSLVTHRHGDVIATRLKRRTRQVRVQLEGRSGSPGTMPTRRATRPGSRCRHHIGILPSGPSGTHGARARPCGPAHAPHRVQSRDPARPHRRVSGLRGRRRVGTAGGRRHRATTSPTDHADTADGNNRAGTCCGSCARPVPYWPM